MKKQIEDFLKKIPKNNEGGNHIFRGENYKYSKVSSTLYRQCPEVDDEVSMPEIEKEIVEKAKRHIRPGATNIEVLTELQHCGGMTSLIDFTQSIPIALFFACEGNLKQDGRIVLVDINDAPEEKDISYDKGFQKMIRIFPTGKGPRMIFQSSVFIRPISGFIEDKKYKSITIKRSIKSPLLDYLGKSFNISHDTIYNDMLGFIRNQTMEWYSPSAMGSLFVKKEKADIKEGECPTKRS